jgi:hypothetical protein
MAYGRRLRLPAIWAAIGLAVLTLSPAVRADVISPTPTLPVLGMPYVPSTGAGCFPTANICVAGGTITLTSLISSTFNMAGQDLLSDAVFSGTLTTLGNTLIGPLTLTGTIEQEVLNRTFSMETGTWATNLVAMSLSGPVQANTLTMTLASSNTSTGQTSITPIGDAGYDISSFFDVFVELTLDGIPPLHATRGPITITLTAPVPEPAGWAIVGVPLLVLTAMRARRRGITVTAR